MSGHYIDIFMLRSLLRSNEIDFSFLFKLISNVD